MRRGAKIEASGEENEKAAVVHCGSNGLAFSLCLRYFQTRAERFYSKTRTGKKEK
jgi:hypothetical protein